MVDKAVPGVVTTVSDWKFQNSYIERLMDHSALTTAHPDDTLILAGPPRLIKLIDCESSILSKLMLQLQDEDQFSDSVRSPLLYSKDIGY